jgi:hypothetical protein
MPPVTAPAITGGVDRALSQAAVDAARIRLESAPRPGTLPAEIVNWLHRQHGNQHALERLRLENQLLSDLERDIGSLDEALYQWGQRRQQAQIDLSASGEYRGQGVPQPIDRSPFFGRKNGSDVELAQLDANTERAQGAIAEAEAEVARLQKRRSALAAQARPLAERRTACIRRIRIAMAGGMGMVFIAAPRLSSATLLIWRPRKSSVCSMSKSR